MAGLSVARELAKQGEKILVLERDRKGGNSSRAAAGIIDPYTEADKDSPLLRLGLAAFQFYEDFLKRLGPRAKEQVEYKKTGVLYLSFSEEDDKFLKSRFDWQRRKKIPVEWLSGEAVRKLIDFYHLDPPEELFILSDDIELKPGEIRFRRSGGSGSHNGLKSIVEHIGESFPRIRIGIGEQRPGEDLSTYVLSRPLPEDRKMIDEAIRKIPEMVREFVIGAS